jgi:predicted nucleic acid-binding protein
VSTEEILRIVVTDSSVVINLHHTSHLGLLRALPTFQFVIPEEVIAEITEPTQAEILSQLIADGSLERVCLENPEELSFFADLSNRLGLGESACLAIAQSRGWLVACDEKRIFLREAKDRLGNARIMNTPGIYVLFIHAGLLTVEEADEAKAILEQHRFRIALVSFRDLIG